MDNSYTLRFSSLTLSLNSVSQTLASINNELLFNAQIPRFHPSCPISVSPTEASQITSVHSKPTLHLAHPALRPRRLDYMMV